ncbi:MAG TPA: (deoxy)nucleoside triphosphate pyrophosphohydrolase [Terriglobales bacterium]|nr:(deoxy)nucleoside triphosphate pyrophosphohydrolase [Terriglobales bacterium]
MDPLAVAAGVICRDGRILVCQRAFDGAHPGKFELPGGKTEPGESLAQCLVRELREELGVAVVPGALLWQSRHRYPGQRPVVLSFFAVEELRGEIVNRVFASLRWVAVAELASVDWLEGDVELVTQLRQGKVAAAETRFL